MLQWLRYLQDVQASLLLHQQTQSVSHVEKVRHLKHIYTKKKLIHAFKKNSVKKFYFSWQLNEENAKPTCSLLNWLTDRTCWPTSRWSSGEVWKWDTWPVVTGPGPD